MQTLQLTCQSYINGGYCHASEKSLQPNYHPATNQIINHIAYAGSDDLQQAYHSSARAFKVWSRMTRQQRGIILRNAAALLRERVAKLAQLEVWDTGKPISEALSVDVYSAADALDYYASAAIALEGSVVPNHDAHIYVTHEPLGVCAAIGAWNYPLQIACWKSAPALMMGNTIIYKPSELTPITSLLLAEIFIQAGMPPGVFNVILGDGKVGEALLSLPGIAKISFTGSVSTGKKILANAANSLLPVTLELGGKSPLIIFSDADLDQAVTGSMLANFYTQGEICSNGTRVFVARDIHQAFTEKIAERTRKLIVGNPFDERTQIGALISPSHLARVLQYIKQGEAEGAELLCGGKQVTSGDLKQGNFVEPTIFTHCSDEMTIVREEIFGPVMSVLTFDDEDEVIQRANNTNYGLAAGIFTENMKRAHRMASQIQAGMCWVNHFNMTPVGMPFGGVKQSGFGRENGLSALLGYSQQKSVYIQLKDIDSPY